jgi:hypothetical protein
MLTLLAAGACDGDDGGSSEGPPIGEVTVTIFRNSVRTTHTFPPTPIALAHVFVDGASVSALTNASGKATVAVSRESSTIHVLTPADQGHDRDSSQLFTITEVPVGADIHLGGGTAYENPESVQLTFPELSPGTTYELFPPSGCFQYAPQAVSALTFRLYFDTACRATIVRIYGLASEPSGLLHIVEKDVGLGQGLIVDMGPYTSAAQSSLELTNLPAGTTDVRAVPGVLSLDGRNFSASGRVATGPVSGTTATIAAASATTTDALWLVVSVDPTRSSTLIVRQPFAPGPSTLDGSELVPIPTLTFENTTASWTLDEAGRAIDGFVLTALIERADGHVMPWTVHGSATTTIKTPTKVPPAVPPVSARALKQHGYDLTFYDIIGEGRRFDVDGSYMSWRKSKVMPRQGVAFSFVRIP